MSGSSMTFDTDKVGPVCILIVTWTSDSSTGAVTGTSPKVMGTLIKAQTFPTAGGATPSSGYSVAITDDAGVDVLSKVETNLTSQGTSAAETYFLVKNAAATPVGVAMHPAVCDKLTFAVTNAGNSKNGTVKLYYIPGAKS